MSVLQPFIGDTFGVFHAHRVVHSGSTLSQANTFTRTLPALEIDQFHYVQVVAEHFAALVVEVGVDWSGLPDGGEDAGGDFTEFDVAC